MLDHPDALLGFVLPARQLIARADRRRYRSDAVLLERLTDLGAGGLAVGRRVKINEFRTFWLRRRRSSGGHRVLLRFAYGALAHFAKALGQPNLQTRQFPEIVVTGLLQLKTPRKATLGIAERKTRHRVAARIAQEIGPEAFICLLGPDDENPPALNRPPLELLLEPFEFVLAPARLEVALGHDDHQDPARAGFSLQLVGQEGGRIDFRVHPNMEAIELRLERVQSVLQPADERLSPIPQRRAAADRIAMRVADENIGVEMRREIGHRRSDGRPNQYSNHAYPVDAYTR